MHSPLETHLLQSIEQSGRERTGRHSRPVPISSPRTGEQYAFEIDLDACSGCKGCVTACHNLNGLDEEETWRSVGLLVRDESAVPAPPPWRPSDSARVIPLQLTVTTACHHCLEPACLSGCPVLAYEKDAHTGIVRHLDDQCIGCSYCLMTCPYEVPKYSKSRGIVRKCDLCYQRLEVGEAPACVQGCPNEAIRIERVDTHSVRALLVPALDRADETRSANADTDAEASGGEGHIPVWLPDAPDPQLTWPTTRYRSKHLHGAYVAADAAHPVPAPAHWPLVALLLLTQMGVGGQVAACGLHVTGLVREAALLFLVSTGLFFAGLGASILHLGQPLKAWRAFMGWRTSWLSREILMFQTAAPVLVLGNIPLLGMLATGREFADLRWLQLSVSTWMMLGTGTALLGVGTSVGVYAATRRAYWSPGTTAMRFLGTVVGAAAGGFATFLDPSWGWLMAAIVLGKPWLDGRHLWERSDQEGRSMSRTRRECQRTGKLLAGPLNRRFRGYCTLSAWAGLMWMAAALDAPRGVLGPAWLLWVAADIMERYHFFRAVAPDKMPGSIPVLHS